MMLTFSYSVGSAVLLYLASSGLLVLVTMLTQPATQWVQQSHYIPAAISSLVLHMMLTVSYLVGSAVPLCMARTELITSLYDAYTVSYSVG